MGLVLKIKPAVLSVNRAGSRLQEHIAVVQSRVNVRFKNLLSQLVSLDCLAEFVSLVQVLKGE